MQRVILGLGSNINDRMGYLSMAERYLCSLNGYEVIHQIHVSSLYESAAWVKEGAPSYHAAPYLNMAVSGICNLSPVDLLEAIKVIEALCGRKKADRWAPREVDIDILFYGDQQMDTQALTIPHALCTERAFALLPAAEIAPHQIYPGAGIYQGMTLLEIAHAHSTHSDWQAPAIALYQPPHHTQRRGL